MEHLIKCYLEQFNNLPRNSLHDRRKRRTAVEYINTLIEGCRRGQNCVDCKDIVREAIIALIRYHEENRANNGFVCKMGKFHNVLYVAVKLCFDWQLQDTGTVVTLLEHIFTCEKSFERIFVGAIFGNKASHYIVGWKSDFDSQEENFRAVVYYIDHATNGGLEFNYGEKVKRFIDIPIESCGKITPIRLVVQLGLPDKLHVFLRYGALIEDDECLTLIEDLLRRLSEFSRVYPYNFLACLQLIFRVVARIDRKKNEMLEEYPELIEDRIVPANRCGIETPELKHLCRCSIRRRLWENYQLPNGIQALSLPISLKKYVDIMQD